VETDDKRLMSVCPDIFRTLFTYLHTYVLTYLLSHSTELSPS